MILRAWQHWLGNRKPRQGHTRRSFNSMPMEHLEMRCVPAINISGTSAVTVTLTGNENITITDDGTSLIVTNTDTSDEQTIGNIGTVTSLRITCSSSSSSNGNVIRILIDGSSVGLSRVTVTGNGGDDLIDASQSANLDVSLNGGSGNDTLIGGDGSDTLDGSSGNDVLLGGSGDDSLVGGSGNDILSGEDGDDLMLGGSGNDSMSGGSDHDIVNGESGNDSLFGDSGNDYIYGGAGRDTVSGGDDSDIVKGQGGLDRILDSFENASDELAAFRALDRNSGETYRGTDTSRAGLDSRDVFDYDDSDEFDTEFIPTADEFQS